MEKMPGCFFIVNDYMEANKLLRSDYIDIVYDRRNKNYGGYELRRNYDRRLKRGTVGLLAGMFLLSSFSLVRNKKVLIAPPMTRVVQPVIAEIEPIRKKDELRIEPPKPVEQQPAKVNTKIFTDPILTDEPIKPEQQMTQNSEMAKVAPGKESGEGAEPGIIPSGPGKTGTGVAVPPPVSNKPLTYVEQMPQFNGAMDAWMSSHLRYPDAARENGIQGRVLVQFVVNEDGAVTDAVIVHGIGGGCDEEALRVINAMPKWKPGKQNGNTVKVLFTLPIKFTLG